MTALATDKQAINQVVRNYVEGMVFANQARLRQAFHPDCRIIGHYHGELEWLSLDDFIAAIEAEGPAPSSTEPVWEVESIDITGDAAAVKMTDLYFDLKFTDYLALLKIGQDWVIVNKLYYYHA
ncbi:nuclear transport factor 2 family protein [Pseudomonas sp. MMS21-TM103]|uniref:nuclear transport factor 2 family protein n=1 Tax=Pseudomonas sp. MMS21 TM103 TaxID=2886506 RepID=UPI001EDF64E2|nr:nuclear transport factor 2 family protein [Pseudomonas sp. MMS21 TM103]MCG4453891.1 nuclear transport factor 2 family protein [Pseudomonas sp. MMS21 TM103]